MVLLTHLHPALCAIKPPQIGPRTGPKRGPKEKTDIARPRCSASNMSDITPPPMVKHADPPIPVRSLKTINAGRFGASAQPIWNRTKKDVEILRTILRPYVSLKGDRSNGPACISFVRAIEQYVVSWSFCLHHSQTNNLSLQGGPK